MSPNKNKALSQFIIRVLLWLPLGFAVWYFGIHVLAAVAISLTQWVLEQWVPFVTGSQMDWAHHALQVSTKLNYRTAEGLLAQLAPEVDVLIYSYGIGMWLGLQRATGGAGEWWKQILGLLCLQAVLVFSLFFFFMQQVAFQAGPEVSAALNYSQSTMNVIALGYQLGSLVLPNLSPVLLWLALNQKFVRTLLPQLAGPGAPAPHA